VHGTATPSDVCWVLKSRSQLGPPHFHEISRNFRNRSVCEEGFEGEGGMRRGERRGIKLWMETIRFQMVNREEKHVSGIMVH